MLRINYELNSYTCLMRLMAKRCSKCGARVGDWYVRKLQNLIKFCQFKLHLQKVNLSDMKTTNNIKSEIAKKKRTFTTYDNLKPSGTTRRETRRSKSTRTNRKCRPNLLNSLRTRKKKHQKPFKERVCSLSVSCCQTYTKTENYSSLAHDAAMMMMMMLM